MQDFSIRTADQLVPLFVAFRKRSGLSQAELARRIGVGQQTVSQLERNPDKATLERLLRALTALDVELVLRSKVGVAIDGDATVPNKSSW